MMKTWLKQLDDNTPMTIITANQRLSTHLLKDDTQFMQEGETIEKPDILSINTWLERCYHHCLDTGHLHQKQLNSLQQYALWHNIISHTEGLDLLRTDATIYSVQQAYANLQQWLLPIDETLLSCSADTQIFYQWATQYQHVCKDYHFIDPEQLIHIITALISKNVIPLKKHICFIGFIEFTPAQQQLINTLKKHGIHCETISHPHHPVNQIEKVSASTADEEIDMMVQWALSTAERYPDYTIACLIPNLSELRPNLVKSCENLFPANRTYNISGGEPLAHHSMIHHALLLFKLCFSSLNFIDLSQLIRSPYLHHAEQEIHQRVLFEIHVRKMQYPALSLPTVTQQCEQYVKKTQQCHHLLTIFDALSSYREKLTAHNHPSHWVTIFITLLNLAGWPGETPLNSEQYQRHQTWQNLLHQFSSLDWIDTTIDFNHALHQLKHHAQESLFQKKSVDTHIYFLGLLEAVGSYFDCIWMSNCNDQHWPAAAKPNPFLPIELQRQHAMPHASAQRELHFSQSIMHTLQHSCQHLYFSFSKQEGDQCILPSSLINHYPNAALSPIAQPPTTPVADYEFLNDDYAPMLTENARTAGGSTLFRLQASCPFRAFATLRLQAKALESSQNMLTAAQRGNITHAILQHLWQTIKNHHTLMQMQMDDQTELIKTTVLHALSQFQNKYPHLLKPRFFQLEAQRLCELMEQWLNYEKNREPFSVIATETQQTMNFAGMQINLTVDRIDQLDNNTQFIIDYKTSEPTPKDWFGERLNEPQLPLYAIVQKTKVAGIAFAQLRRSKMQFKGVTKVENTLTDCNTIDTYQQYTEANTWQQQLTIWEKELTVLGKQYANGFAAVDPKSPQSCQYCDLRLLCRIQQDNEVDDVL
jgi:ATP-dependent helicase/nuclease subunit B